MEKRFNLEFYQRFWFSSFVEILCGNVEDLIFDFGFQKLCGNMLVES